MEPPSEYIREGILEVFDRRNASGTPLTTREIADEVGCDREAATEILGELADGGTLETRELGDHELWWPANDQSRDGRSDARTDFDRAQFHELVETVTDYAIFALDRDGHVRTWNEGAKQLKGYEKDEIIGEHFSTFYTEEDREAGRPEENLRRATKRGRIEDEGERVREDGSTFWANVTITALYSDDGELRGYTKVTRDMTERHEYEQALERERERLEIMNRIVRHNVLNGLNLVNARTQILQSNLADDHESQTHLETIRSRVQDLASLIDTMRKFMDAVVSDSAHETEPIPVRDTLEEKIALARDTYPEADFEVRDLPDPATRVVADELITEVFENVLSNAVVHNDENTPRVEVWTSETTREVRVDSVTGEPLLDQGIELAGDDSDVREWPALAVHVADNGPGIPDEDKKAIFEKGVSELREPGNGFGLYLVSEMMDAYGGAVDVSDPEQTGASRDTDGTVFDLVFLRADDEAPPN